MSRSSSLSGSTPQYTFVTGTAHSGARSHAMREHWKKRRQRNRETEESPRRASLRTLLPRSRTSPPSPREVVSPLSDPSSSSILTGSEDTQRDIFPNVSSQLLCRMSYALSSSRPDPFQTCPIHLNSQHQKLLHHWLSTHAAMMFDNMEVTEFNPMRDVWFPLDFSNASSFNLMMAHSAAHLSHLYSGTPPQRGTKSSDAINYKIEAVRILRAWLDDPEKRLSDNSFAAIVRLLTFERYWGTVEEWNVHRIGLQSMIDAIGGIQALHNNWRLELVLYLVSLMSRPSWLEPTNDLGQISSPLFDLHRARTHSIDVQKVRCLWLISFVQDMRTFMGSFYHMGLSSYSFTHAAVGLLRHEFALAIGSPSRAGLITECEDEILGCLFSISVLIQESLAVLSDQNSRTGTSVNPLDELEKILHDHQDVWDGSVRGLRYILYASLERLFDGGAFKVSYITDLVHVLGTLSLESRHGVEKCLLNLLYSLGNNDGTLLVDDGWTPDSLLSSMQGH